MATSPEQVHPSSSFLRPQLTPSVWCAGCGIGTVVNSFIEAVGEAKIDTDRICAVSGIGCTGKISECLNFKLQSITDGNAIGYAANFKLANPDLKVVVFTNNADFLLSGGTDFIESAKKDANILLIHINNAIYTVAEKEIVPITPFMRLSADKAFDLPFNIPHLAGSCGARYVARWMPLRAGWLTFSMVDALSRPGFSVIEVVSPCVTYYATSMEIADPVKQMEFYESNSVVKYHEPTENLDLRAQNKIILGKFVDK